MTQDTIAINPDEDPCDHVVHIVIRKGDFDFHVANLFIGGNARHGWHLSLFGPEGGSKGSSSFSAQRYNTYVKDREAGRTHGGITSNRGEVR